MTSHRQTKHGYALLLVAGLLLAVAVEAKTINVPSGKPTIQAAIDAAAEGDVVVVAKGTYKENIDFKGKAITVQSTKPTDKTVVAATIIDGDKKGSVVVFQSGEKATSVLKGFTLTNGTGTLDTNGYRQGGGVYCSSASPTLTYNLIKANRATKGGGLTCWENSAPRVTGNTISDNTITGSGGGVYCYNSSPTLAGNTISGNQSLATNSSAGGIACYWYSSPVIKDNLISNNLVTPTGGTAGGVSCTYNSSPTLTGNTITGNAVGDDGGGVYCKYDSSPTMANNTIKGNTAGGDGGGVYCDYKASPTMSGNTISGNVATAGGGGVHCNYSTAPVLSNNLIAGNSAVKGGGLYVTYATPSLTNNTLSGNSATSGGGVCCYREAAPTIKNTIIAFSLGGGGLCVEEGSSYPSSPVITYCDLYGNTGGNYVNWPSQTGKHGNLSKNPLFANLAKGDYHLKSKGGRWNRATKTWVIDTVHSPCIDVGDPASAFALEPAPNGGRVNMGAYGNTAQASKSAPVAPVGGLQVSAAAAPASGGGAQLSVNLSAAASVEVTITNLAGRTVAALPVSDLPEGTSTLLWSGKSTTGLRVPAGTYLARFTARTEDGHQCQALTTVTLRR